MSVAVKTIPDSWVNSVRPVKLGEGEVHVWRACLDVSVEELQARSKLLTEEERARGARYLRPEVGTRFVAGRGLLRRLLGMYLGANAADVEFSFNSFGKPSLPPKQGAGDLFFNVSHSRDWALLAFTRGREVGVDIERVRPDFATLEIAQRFFSPAESERLQALPAGEQAVAFFQCWTRKEGYIKARGVGLSLGLDSFEVAFGPGLEPAVLKASDEVNALDRWLVLDLQPQAGFAGALVVERPVETVCCWNSE
jgi:4'-phosphopantetheinyl transferase